MFMQSAAMALGFGSFFQYGKRKISSMSNEEFNVLTPEVLTSQLLSNVNNMIPSVQQSFKQMEQMNVLILDAMATYFSQGVAKLEQWIQGRGENLVSNLENATGYVSDDTAFLEGLGIQTAGGAEYIPPTNQLTSPPSTTSFNKLNAIEKFASKWINYLTGVASWNTISQKEMDYLFKQKQLGNMPNTSQGLINAGVKFTDKKFKPQTLDDAAAKIKTTSTGDVKQIATLFNFIRIILKKWKATKSNTWKKQFLIQMKLYNKLVQSLGRANLSIDTAKSLKAQKIIPK